MNHNEDTFSYNDINSQIEYQNDGFLFFPIKISINFKVKNGLEIESFVFSEIFFKSKEECVNFLKSEVRNIINSKLI